MPNSKIIRTAPETQEEKGWNPPSGTLGELVAAAHRRSEQLNPDHDFGRITRDRRGIVSLESALRGEAVAIIAEIKRSSPSKGSINPQLDSSAQAAAYETGGASAISVLTEPDRFGGSDEDIVRAKAGAALPILKKDFHVTPRQLAHAAGLGVSAALVIVRALSPENLASLAATAREVDLELVFEVRDERELDRALSVDARMIGVNNRNLETLEVHPDTVSRIVPLIPSDRIAIAESGYTDRASIESAADAGADAVLIGSYVSASRDPASAVTSIASIPRIRRG
ncbi:MAG TPA: indole-3-glycerol phosphate synthase TrpC [Gemmatimonadaceae bacterium]